MLASIYSMHRDPTEYDRANEFKPQRHLDSNIKFKLPRSFRPYGIGKGIAVKSRTVCSHVIIMFFFTWAVYKSASMLLVSEQDMLNDL